MYLIINLFKGTEQIESTFFKNLKSTKWILAEYTEFKEKSDGYLVSSKDYKFEAPSNIYIKEQIFLRYYGMLVPYSLEPFNSRCSLINDLNFKTEFNINEFIIQFQKWTELESKFYASISQMKNIYTLFSNYLNRLVYSEFSVQ